MLDEYYSEKAPEKREKMLVSMREEGVDATCLGQMEKLFSIRYQRNKNGAFSDRFMGAWTQLLWIAEKVDSNVAKKKKRRQAAEILGCLCLDREGEFSGEVLYREMCHLAALYASACSGDRMYKSYFLGFGRVGEDGLRARLSADFDRIGRDIPASLDMRGEFHILSAAIEETKKRIRIKKKQSLFDEITQQTGEHL